MKTLHTLLLCVLGAALLSSVLCADAIGPDNCCFSFYPRRLPGNLIASYSRTDPQCPMDALIFVTKKSRKLCVDPNQPWVQDVIKPLDEESF